MFESKNFNFTVMVRCLLTMILPLAILAGCSGSSQRNVKTLEQLEVRWRLVQNHEIPSRFAEVQFVFINNGTRKVRQGDWTMDFTQYTIMPLSMADSTKGAVEHVNGYFFRFTPGEDFIVHPW
jgi:hexosaminidase